MRPSYGMRAEVSATRAPLPTFVYDMPMTDGPWREERLLIDGKLSDSSSGSTFDNVNPATAQVLGVTADGTGVDMDAAIAAARRAFDGTDWSRNLAARLRGLRQLQEALVRHQEDLRATIVAEVGSPLSGTYGAQLDAPVAALSWVIDLAERYGWESDLGRSEPFGVPTQRWVWREAIGVVGAITPWNYPLQINLAKVGPALAAGCTVVLKPAPDTPWSGTLLGRLVAEETDIPPGVFNVVVSSDHSVGQQLAEDPRVDMVSFTGSTRTGQAVMRAGASNLKKVFLELGGKSALVVLDDADMETAAATAAFQVMSHAGQGCAITSRLLLPRTRYDEGVAAVVTMMGALAYGDPTDPNVYMGPLINQRQRERVLGYIRQAIDQGATVATGGGVPEHLPEGFFVEPTALAGVEPEHIVAQEEVFGPVLAILAHDGDDDAVRIANGTPYGLSGGVISADRDRTMAVARRMRTGTIGCNGGVWYGPDVPFGGYGHSGIGREMGVAGFEEYLETKSVAEPA